MPESLNLEGRVAVIIGATSGIGRTLAVGFAKHGADVVATGRREAQVDEVCREIEATGRRTLRHVVDVGKRESLDKLRDAVVKQFGRVDILLNAAGYTFKKPTIEVAEAEWLGVMDTNLNGILRACQSFYEPLKTSKRGRIVNIASVGSFRAFHQVAAYTASKAAVISLTQSLACEWAREGICVNAIAPGIFETDMNRELINGTPRGKELLMRTPMGRFGQTDELLGAAVLLASDAASFITGQCIAVDGGFLVSGVNA